MSENSSIKDTLSHPFALGLMTALAGVGAVSIISKLSPRVGRMMGTGRYPINRMGADSARSCAVLEHNGVVYVSGQVAVIETLAQTDIKQQTKETLAKIDALLAQAGTDKEHMLNAQIWLKDIDRDFVAMNEVWNAYLAPNGTRKPVRACVQAPMARKNILVEIKVVAALPQ